MKLNPNYILRQVAGETLLVSVRDASAPKRVLCLNELARDIFALLQSGLRQEEIVTALLEQYEVEEPLLRTDVGEFLAELTRLQVLLPDEEDDAP